MIANVVTIASRKSQLAMWQAEHAKLALQQTHPELTVEIKGMLTQGDKLLATPLYNIGGKALFVKELEKAILERRADIAVHSIKDLPVELPDGLGLSVIMERGDPRDALVSNDYDSVEALPEGALIGTSSLRRQSQIKVLRPDLNVQSLRGNVITRLQKLDEGQYDAIILATAGLKRLKLEERITLNFDIDLMLPGVGQGAIGIECRLDDEKLVELLAPLNHGPTRQCVETERLVIEGLDGSCKVPLAAYADIHGEDIRLRALVGKIDGSKILKSESTGPIADRQQIANRVIEDLIAQGADKIIDLYR